MAGVFGDALMRLSRTRVPSGGAQFGSRAPNADAIRMATPAPGAIKPSEAASEAQLPPEIQAYLSMMTGAPGAAAGAMSPPPMTSAPPVPQLPPEIPEQIAPMPIEAPAPTISKAMRIRAPRPPDVDVQVLGITQPDGSWQAAFYDRNGRRANTSDYEMRAFAADQIARTGRLPTKAEWIFQRFQNFDQEPGGVSEFS